MEDSDETKEPNDETSSSIKPKSKIISSECKICGAPALHSNYGAMTCYPCKMFFKRNTTKQLTCELDGHCGIDMTNRYLCSACRLDKCFASGMKADLIRCPSSKKSVTTKTSNTTIESVPVVSNILTTTTSTEHDQLQLLPTTNLLELNTSILTTNQSRLLSNLIYSYDESKLLSIAQQFINECNDVDISDLTILFKEFFEKIYQTTEIYIRSNTDFYTLSSNDRSAFLRNIVENVTCFSIAFCWNRTKISNCKSFINICTKFYGENLVTIIQRLFKFIDPDIILTKLTLSLFAFSNNISLFSSNMIIEKFNTQTIFHIQNTHAETIWKYLLYKYGYYQSIQRFINLIQCLLIGTNTVFDIQNIEKHIDDIESLVEQTELALLLDDVENIVENKN